MTAHLPRATKAPAFAVPPPVTQSLSEQVYDWLKERIFTGDLAADERLDIVTLARQARVSRTPMRDAINRLAMEGLVVIRPRRGTRVSALTTHELEAIFDARALIEPTVCAAAAEVASTELISTLRSLQAEWERINPKAVYKDYELHSRYAELDASFHLSIVDAVGNPKLNTIIAGLNIQRRVAPLVFDSDYRGPVRRVAEHRKILEALRQRDPEGTRIAVLDHIQNARHELIAFLERSGAESQQGHVLARPRPSRGGTR